MPSKTMLRGLGDDGDFFPDDLPDPGSSDTGGGDDSGVFPPAQDITDIPTPDMTGVTAAPGTWDYYNQIAANADNAVGVPQDPASVTSQSSATNGAMTGAAGDAVRTANPNLQSGLDNAFSSGNLAQYAALARMGIQAYQANGASQLQTQRLQNAYALQMAKLTNSRAQMPLLLFAGVAVAFLIMKSKER